MSEDFSSALFGIKYGRPQFQIRINFPNFAALLSFKPWKWRTSPLIETQIRALNGEQLRTDPPNELKSVPKPSRYEMTECLE